MDAKMLPIQETYDKNFAVYKVSQFVAHKFHKLAQVIWGGYWGGYLKIICYPPIQMNSNKAGLDPWHFENDRLEVGFPASFCVRMSSWRWRCRGVSQKVDLFKNLKHLTILWGCVWIAFNPSKCRSAHGWHLKAIQLDPWKIGSKSVVHCGGDCIEHKRQSLFKLWVESYVHCFITYDGFHISFMNVYDYKDIFLDYSTPPLNFLLV